ncbi:salivary peroxidase/catechol oxidase-like [Haliotis cracherodii]|uniref:salivary peroxidase/catechol oxidase-like n=1 Tax=Haliotis cracherodii TaxID=6455 RepID=UPI0039ED4C55
MLKRAAIGSQLILLLMVAKTDAALAFLNDNIGQISLSSQQQEAAVTQARVQLEEELSQESVFAELDRAASEPGSTTDQLNKFTFTAPESIIKGNNHRINVLEVTQLLQAANVSQEEIPLVLKKGFGPKLECDSSLVEPCKTSSPYRTANGSCNNLEHTTWGKAVIPMRRWLDPAYDDHISSPREKSHVSSSKLPSARLVSTTVHTPSTDADRHASYTHMLMQWGQFLDHDITSTPKQKFEANIGPYGRSFGCCFQPRPLSRQCFPIVIPQPDRHFKSTCMNFVRSVQVENEHCQAAPVEQLNQITAYIDASQVYGSSQEEQNKLRTFVDGQLKMKSTYLPSDSEPSCTTTNSTSYCFLAGDHRVNENPTLQSMHTIFTREHNRIAKNLKALNCHWSDEITFQEARKIVGAIIQVITYDECLPIILGKEEMNKYGLTLGSGFAYANVYNTTTDARIRSAFATAAFRMGHSMIRSFIKSFSPSYINLGKDKLSESFGNTTLILNVTNRKVDHYIRGLAMDDMQDSDYKLSQEITDNLFADSNGNSMDLAALNIQRGRDHGLPSYTKWRKYCNIPEATPFSGLAYTTHTAKAAGHLKDVYRHIDDIDLFPGALSEKPVPGGMVGPTFTCLLAKQFQALKEGDRFWFEEDNANVKFTQYQLNEIRKASLSRVVCDNTDTYKIQKNAFIKGSPVWCSTLDEINLTHWRETQPLGLWTTWQTWSGCDGGQQTRTRSCSTCSCIGQSAEKKSCNLNPCDEGSWGPWSECRRGRRSRHCSCTNGCSRRRRSSNRVDGEDEAAAMFAHPLFGEEESMTVTACLCSGLVTQDMACV